MTGNLLLRGMIVGILAGLIAFAFAYTFGEPQVDLAIAYEDQVSAAAAAASTEPAIDEPPLVTRETQAGIGLLTALVGFGAAIGGTFALVFALAYGRLGGLGARSTAALLALAAFVATGLVPQLKYPANPPAVGFDETIAARTSLFFVLLALSVICMVIAVLVAQRLWHRYGAWTAGTLAGALYVALLSLTFLGLPAINEMPEGFDPMVVWNFRVASLGIHLVLWLVIGLGFGIVTERLVERPRARLHAAA
ncbi:CbtA family protein [Frigidibacter mobilis]|uniref:Cobalt transporter CbtA n=1 Tax=Frigidibacter mobilis TaxID=1335048 RepID=A0A165SEP8_9RHOB|nr:CbtA family protein [Frigidibacter mobilis]AMY67313.1 hypothetical protein AKL17_0051 [Frigidibacter mobilis]